MITEKEASELQLLRLLQADKRRWLSMDEFCRISELSRKASEPETEDEMNKRISKEVKRDREFIQ